ncbi:hypothetical protein ACEN2J_11665 [Pseudorhodobacter sp. W20_MBD10_FR17]|uniref:hypothetical protein n=1 Tax=Pseudorhodobacter sp. W20_MBD10_FR17 TaxID=3240266 RepID=UPI003F9CFD6F
MKHTRALLIPAMLLSSCGYLPFYGDKNAAMEPAASIATHPQTRPNSAGAVAPPKGARTIAALDTTTAAQKAEALSAPAQPAAEQALGKTAVALGKVTEAGFWLRSSLVQTAGKGRVVTANGASIAVDLIPGTGAAQLSLAAFRALNLPLTDLPEVTIFAQ